MPVTNATLFCWVPSFRGENSSYFLFNLKCCMKSVLWEIRLITMLTKKVQRKSICEKYSFKVTLPASVVSWYLPPTECRQKSSFLSLRIWLCCNYTFLLHIFWCGEMPLLFRSSQFRTRLTWASQGMASSRLLGKQTKPGNSERSPGKAVFIQRTYPDLKENISAVAVQVFIRPKPKRDASTRLMFHCQQTNMTTIKMMVIVIGEKEQQSPPLTLFPRTVLI